jgi:hypothetical protein
MLGPAKESPFYRDEARPFAARDDVMSLDTIRPKDVPRGKALYVKPEDNSLKTQDIHKAEPFYSHLQYLDKPDLSVGSTDPLHAGGKASSYYPAMDRRPRDMSLTTADIEYAQPKAVKRRGNRHTDPICPEYELPTCYKREATPPRFLGRHTNDISDIEHSCPRVLHPERSYTRNLNDASDIEYASANYQERLGRSTARPRQDRSLNVTDIMGNKPHRARQTNPLDPVYQVPCNKTTSMHATFAEEQGMAAPPATTQHVGEVLGSKPRKLHWDNGEPQLSLLREDIAGAVPQRFVGSIPANVYDPPDVRPMLSFHDPNDIAGAQVGSLKRGDGLRHGYRGTNPLNPRYQMLDGEVRPQPMPTFDTERGAAHNLHPMMRSQAASASAPNLHGTRTQGSSRAGSSYGRDASQGTLLQAGMSAMM